MNYNTHACSSWAEAEWRRRILISAPRKKDSSLPGHHRGAFCVNHTKKKKKQTSVWRFLGNSQRLNPWILNSSATYFM